MRTRVAIVSALVYVGAIILANWMIAHVGLATPTAHLWPVGFGLMAPSGTYCAALTFPARDVLQRAGGRWWGVAAIFVGAGVSFAISTPTIAVASGLTFLFSETADFLIYTPIQRRHFPAAVVASGLTAAVVDSVLFLRLAGIPFAVALPGLLLAKAYVQLVAGPATYGLRKVLPTLAVAR